ncbi:helix-turn-helix domain-containing protein [Piscinibacter gummiphilus]|uniref:Transcriptional regulator n=1 Tax=Piscinibacter gummiphilus TaxID=946333 RepID=A0A1W6L8N0_9BURK|nr:helix-turn-helix transcriptional regulator [Piscinibacter gummiphilus]ARN20574.1 transcriptional regulator [Piscinibacter gummiphilus]ATU65250.1 transcriptional regulator [Piscinibacter gummiphilus]GLS98344.1 transcriptional regulator [Piscinibacter gummiphilus]
MNHRLVTAAQLGQLLQTARRAAGRSQADLAATVGLSQSRLSKLELNPGTLTVDQLLALCASLDLELTLQPRSAGPGAESPPDAW